jgi:hypothetical protein
MMYWIADVCRNHDNLQDDHGRLVAVMLASFAAADAVCRRAGRHFTEGEHEDFSRHIEHALLTNNALAAEAVAAGEKLYKLIPKHHALSHIAYDFSINPRRVQCYADEDMVGRMKRLYIRCHGRTAPQRSLLRYSILAALRWWEELRVLRDLPPDV